MILVFGLSYVCDKIIIVNHIRNHLQLFQVCFFFNRLWMFSFYETKQLLNYYYVILFIIRNILVSVAGSITDDIYSYAKNLDSGILISWKKRISIR